MRLIRLNAEILDHTFWQVACFCRREEFLAAGELFLASLELNAPDCRVVLCIQGYDAACRALIDECTKRIHAVSLYLLESEEPPRAASQSFLASKYRLLLELLESTQIPTFVVNSRVFFARDIALLPLEMQKCDVGIYPQFSQRQGSKRVVSDCIWLAPKTPTFTFLRGVDDRLNSLRNARLTAQDEARSLWLNLAYCRSFLRFAPLPQRYVDRKCGRKSYVWARIHHAKLEEAVRVVGQTLDRFRTPVDTFILVQRQDLGTKTQLENNDLQRRLTRLQRPGRIYWRFAARLLAEMAWCRGENARVVGVPQWEIARVLSDRVQGRRAIVSHLSNAQVDAPNASFFMQMLIPSLFTHDPWGWGPASSSYGSRQFERVEPTRLADQFITSMMAHRITKAPQKVATRQGGALAVRKFDVLAPLQVPNDDALIFHSDVGLEEYVDTLADWAHRERVRVLFKRHPFDLTDLVPRMKVRHDHEWVAFTEEGHVHDLICQASLVCVINSGVGFEAMVYNKPVLTFGRAIYDVATMPVTAATLPETYHRAIGEAAETRRLRYRRFVEWFVFHAGLKVDEPRVNLTSLRDGTAELSDNPVYPALMTEMKLSMGGVKKKKVPSARRPLKELAIVLRFRRDRLEKRASMRARHLRKKYWHPIDTFLKRRVLHELAPGLFDGKRVALVGNASSIRELQFGELIDAHDLVIRMNLGHPLIVRKEVDMRNIPDEWVVGRFSDARTLGREVHCVLSPHAPRTLLEAATHVRAVGLRTDVWSCSTNDKLRQLFFADKFNCRTVACHPGLYHLSWKLLLKTRVNYLPPSVCEKLREGVALQPTSGLIWFEYLMTQNVQSLSLFGFDFFQSRHINRVHENLLIATGKWPHDPAAEETYILERARRDPKVKIYGLKPETSTGDAPLLVTHAR